MKHRYSTGLNLRGDFLHHRFDRLQGELSNLDFNALAVEMTFFRLRPAARRQVQPRFGQSITARYTKGLNAGEPMQLFAAGWFYFPGLHKTHSFNVRASYEDNTNTNTYRYLSTFRGSRSYAYYPFDEVFVASLNYEFPVWHPDYYLSKIVGVTRMRVNTFFDFSEGRTKDFTQQRRSVGGELIFDLRLFRAFNMDLRL